MQEFSCRYRGVCTSFIAHFCKVSLCQHSKTPPPPPLRSMTTSHWLHQYLLPRCFGLPLSLPPSSTSPPRRVVMTGYKVRWRTLSSHTSMYPVQRTNWIFSPRSTPHLTATNPSPTWQLCCCRGTFQKICQKDNCLCVSAFKVVLGSKSPWMCRIFDGLGYKLFVDKWYSSTNLFIKCKQERQMWLRQPR